MPNQKLSKKRIELSQNEMTILKVVASYRLGFFQALRILTGIDLKSLDLALKSLVRKKLILRQRSNQMLAKKCPLYFLTSEGAKYLGLNRDKTIPTGPGTISNHLSVLWFCSIEKKGSFKRVENSQIEQVLGCKFHRNKVHVAGKIKDRFVVLRRYRPDSVFLGEKLKKIKKIVEGLPPELDEAVDTGDYGLLILEKLPCAVNLMLRQIGKTQKVNSQRQSIAKAIRTVVGVGPSTRTFQTVFTRTFPE